MYRNFVTVTALILSTATSAAAFEFTGGTIGANYTSYPDVENIDATELSSSVEFAINPQFSVALGMTSTSYDVNGPYDLTSSNTVLHAIYNVNGAVKLGAFVGRENLFYYGADTYGIEAAFDGGAFDVAGYLGAGDFISNDVTFYGLNGGYTFGAGFGINADVDIFEINDADYTLTTSSIGVEYGFGNGITISADAGQFKFEQSSFSDDEKFVTIGASFAFGPQGGVSFEAPEAFSSLFFMGPA